MPPLAAPLLEEHFDSPAPAGWVVSDGARVGSGPRSRAGTEDGALVIRVEPGDERFVQWTHPVEPAGAPWLHVHARMRTERVDPNQARYDSCDLFVRAPGGAVRVSRVLVGTNPWTEVDLVVPVPRGARSLDVGAFLSMPGSVWFDDIVVEASDSEFLSAAQGHFIYHWLAGDGVAPADRAANEENLASTAAFFGVPTEGLVIPYWKYPDVSVKERHTGLGGNAHTDLTNVFSIWSTDDHEIVHILATRWCRGASALFSEGLAVWVSGDWLGLPVAEAADVVSRAGKWIPLQDLLTAFRRAPDRESYAIAGAFVGWVSETRGKDGLRTAYAEVHDPESFARVLGTTVEDADTALRAWVAKATTPP
jgi:hypothetical protein